MVNMSGVVSQIGVAEWHLPIVSPMGPERETLKIY